LVLESVSGLRGVYGSDLTEEYVRTWSSKFATFTRGATIAVGCDTRPSSAALLQTVIFGLLSGGCRVQSLGLVTSPELFRYVRVNELRGGIMVTASHNPPQWNGLKFIVAPGRGVYQDELERIREAKQKVGEGSIVMAGPSTYYDDIVNIEGPGCVRGVKVAVDPGGGSGCKAIPQTLVSLGADVRGVNLKAGIFNRLLDPTEDRLSELVRLVVNEKCDIGFAFDGDADRLVVMDGRGRKLSADTVLCLTALLVAAPGMKVVLSVDTSSAVSEIVKERGGEVVMAQVGEANVVRSIISTSSSLGGEGSSGGAIFPDFNYCRDGLLAAAKIAKALNGQTLERLLSKVPEHHLLREKVPMSVGAMTIAMKALALRFPDAQTLDGLRVDFGKAWMLFRPSRTEEAMRISVEAKTEEEAKELMEEARAALREAAR